MQEAIDVGTHVPDGGPLASESPIPKLPKAPSPSKDPGVAPSENAPIKDLNTLPPSNPIDIFELAPAAALKILCDTVEALVQLTGDVPPTPPITQPGTPNLGLIQAEKENVARHIRERHHSRQNSASSFQDIQRARKSSVASPLETHNTKPESSPITSTSSTVDANKYTETLPISATSPIYIIDSTTESTLNLQHTLIIRKFYSKTLPPIPLPSYLQRIHTYCPMSTAVYLATSLFLHRLAVIERIIPVTSRNAHRLLLAGLRVSMKKLEDQKYGHSRFARVGGVTELELGKLEVGFCFLTSFDLRASEGMLREHAEAMRDGSAVGMKGRGTEMKPALPILRKKQLALAGNGRAVSPMGTVMKAEAPAAA